MKNLYESLFELNTTQTAMESLFDNDLTSKKPAINGVSVDDYAWKKCEKYFKSILKKYKKITSEDKSYDVNDYHILYAYNDCIIWFYDANGLSDRWLYVLAPETIYINYTSIKHNAETFPWKVDIDINNLDEFDYGNWGDLKFNFVAKINYFRGENPWHTLKGISSIPVPKTEGIGSNLLCRGYLPFTISKKAKDIINKYVK